MNSFNSINSIAKFSQSSGPQLTGISYILSQATVWVDSTDFTTLYNSSTQLTAVNQSLTKWINKNNKSTSFNSVASNQFTLGNTFNSNKYGIKSSSSSSYMTFSNPSILPYLNYSIFVVCSFNDVGPYGVLGIGSATTPSNQAQLILAYSNNMYIHSGAGVACQNYQSFASYGTGILTYPFIYEYLKTQSSNDGYYTGNIMTYADNDAVSTGSNPQSFCSIFCHSGNGTFNCPANAYISEVLIFPTMLNSNDRQAIEGYLAFKYNFQQYLPSNHLYKNSPPT